MIQGQGRGVRRLDEMLNGGPSKGRRVDEGTAPAHNAWGRRIREDEPGAGAAESEDRRVVEQRILAVAPTSDQIGGHTDVSAQSAARKRAAEAASVRTNPWGRPVAETVTAPKTPQAADFREVGLTPAQASSAAAGLAEGRFLSFEDACLSAAVLGARRGAAVNLDEAAMRSKARTFLRSS